MILNGLNNFIKTNMNKILYTDLYSQYQEAKASIDSAIKEVIQTSSFITGPMVDEFENTIKNYCESDACASIGSGTNALLCALKAANIGKGDEVITVSHTFVSTPEAIINAGATPIFVDIDDCYHININNIEDRITDNTKAILFVDLYGQTPNITSLKVISSHYNLILIEDAAQSFGSKYKEKRVGSLADLTCFSFNPIKNLGAMGDAGAVTGSKKLIDKVKMYRDHGRKTKYTYETVGYNARIDNIQARIIQAKLPYVDKWNKGRRQIAHTYTKELENIIQTPIENQDSYHVYYVYAIQIEHRDSLQQHLKEAGIQTNIHYRTPTHKTSAFSKYSNNFLRNTEYECERLLSLPVYHSLTESNQQYIIDTIKNWL
jgi:dTDP-4-amino-4,6-dideoxygalactose transaminase